MCVCVCVCVCVSLQVKVTNSPLFLQLLNKTDLELKDVEAHTTTHTPLKTLTSLQTHTQNVQESGVVMRSNEHDVNVSSLTKTQVCVCVCVCVVLTLIVFLHS